MSILSKRIIKEHTGILLGTVETHECDPLMDCPECHGKGTCQECRGSGEVKCHNCHGNGQCPDCRGKGQWRCDECAGTGDCRKCRGTGEVRCSKCNGRGRVTDRGEWKDCPKCGGSGYTPCPDCRSGLQTAVKVASYLTLGDGRTYGKGTGKCSKCGGSGEIICKTCEGSGNCQTCNGSGQLTCEHCGGSGDCPNCDHGKVTCTRCEGSGFYQSFIRYNTTLYAKKWEFAGSKDYSDIVNTAHGLLLYNGSTKTWLNAQNVATDRVVDVNNHCSQELGEERELYEEFLEEYGKQTELVKPDQNNDKPYATELNVQRVPVTKISYSINDKDFDLLLIGTNHIAATRELPTSIKGFELSKWQKIKLAMTEKVRLKAYAKLAAYIFQCDGKRQEESVLLEAMVKALDFSPRKEKKFRDQLAILKSPMPYDKFRKIVKPLFSSKKTIVFAWECMAIDKNVTPQEEELFAKISAEYKKLSESEISHLKGMARRFSHLQPDQIAKEYADLSADFKVIRRKVKKILFWIISSILCLLGIIIYSLTSPHWASTNADENSYIEEAIESQEEPLVISRDEKADSQTEALNQKTDMAISLSGNVNLPFCMSLIISSNGDVKGVGYYEKYYKKDDPKTLLYMKGYKEGSELTIMSYNHKGGYAGTFDGTFTDNRFEGEFESYQGKIYDFNMQEDKDVPFIDFSDVDFSVFRESWGEEDL